MIHLNARHSRVPYQMPDTLGDDIGPWLNQMSGSPIPLAGSDLWHFNVLEGVYIDSGPSLMQGTPVFMKSCH